MDGMKGAQGAVRYRTNVSLRQTTRSDFVQRSHTIEQSCRMSYQRDQVEQLWYLAAASSTWWRWCSSKFDLVRQLCCSTWWRMYIYNVLNNKLTKRKLVYEGNSSWTLVWALFVDIFELLQQLYLNLCDTLFIQLRASDIFAEYASWK